MHEKIKGIHHITVVAGDPNENVRFYRDVLGLRLVKKSVNQDATHTYHLFYGDEHGTPGTSITFFPWPDGRDGVHGTGQAEQVRFRIPDSASAYWRERLEDHDIAHRSLEHDEETGLAFEDHDGLQLALVEGRVSEEVQPWDETVPEEHAICGFDGVVLSLETIEDTADLLGLMGFESVDEGGTWRRYRSEAEHGDMVELRCEPSRQRGNGGLGTVHHVAFRTEDSESQVGWKRELASAGLHVTPVIDRHWFTSIYFREPGGVLFEIATEGPGYTRDEELEHLGEKLVLTPWLEERREEIEASLPELEDA